MLVESESGGVCLLNAFLLELHVGIDNCYGCFGCILGLVNVYVQMLVDLVLYKFLLVEMLREWLVVVNDGWCVIVYCGGGILVMLDVFVLMFVGVDDVVVYDGLMMEWLLDLVLLVEMG